MDEYYIRSGIVIVVCIVVISGFFLWMNNIIEENKAIEESECLDNNGEYNPRSELCLIDGTYYMKDMGTWRRRGQTLDSIIADQKEDN